MDWQGMAGALVGSLLAVLGWMLVQLWRDE